MEKKTISEFLSNEYKEFAMYVIEGRSIPSVIDGFKPSQRKIIHVANQIWKTGNEKVLKIFQLGGKVASDCYYHHGDKSLSDAIINMAQKFKNNLPLLIEDGQFGTIYSKTPGAARYIGTKLSKNFRLVYKDFDLLEYKKEEGESIEPFYFLPIIPMVLLNGSPGVAVGFSTTILNRNSLDIVDACINYLKGKDISNISPKLNDFKGTYRNDEENHKKWYIRGCFERVNTSTVKITEITPSMTYEKYETILDTLVDKKSIVSWDDNSKEGVNYTIKFTRQDLAKYDDEQLVKLLKLEESETENYNTLDENGKLKLFESSQDIIKYFVDFRLNYYIKRKQFNLDKLNRELKILQNKGKFIKSIIDNKTIINNVSKDRIIEQITLMNLDKIDDSYDYLLRMPIYSLTIELFNKLKDDFTDKKKEIKEMEELQPKDMYLTDLNELKKSLK